jgi:hypothetical protein
MICPVDGGACRPIPGFAKGSDGIFQWSADGRSLFVGQPSTSPLLVYRLDLATGHRELWHQFQGDGVGNRSGIYYFTMSPDARSYAYSCYDTHADLYLVTGLK